MRRAGRSLCSARTGFLLPCLRCGLYLFYPQARQLIYDSARYCTAQTSTAGDSEFVTQRQILDYVGNQLGVTKVSSLALTRITLRDVICNSYRIGIGLHEDQ